MNLDFKNGVDSVKITILSNNTADITLQTDPRYEGRVVQPGRKAVLAMAEHGLAMSIEVDGTNILYDFGGMGLTLLKNLKIFQINPMTFQKVVLSHGHFDHFGALLKLLPILGPGKEIIVSNFIYKQKIVYVGKSGETININTLKKNYRALKNEGKIRQMPGLKRFVLDKLIVDNHQHLIETRKPVELVPGVWTSGEIEILDETELSSNLFIMQEKMTFERDTFRDEIAIYINVKEKGLIILTGCGHCGIMNIIKYGQKLSGIDKIYAVIGGFHLNWSSLAHLNRVLTFFQEIHPTIICGLHCTGGYFNAKLITFLPNNATLGIVGTTFYL
ncbi:MAG: MBL fold metallo-hydrolase [Promethearchaeota archaeon]